jgi:putative transposase
MNMFRAGVVGHPSEWAFSGYNEIQAPHECYALIDYEVVRKLLNFRGMDEFAAAYRVWIQEAVSKGKHFGEGKWTESIAVGSAAFVTATKDKLGVKGIGREVIGGDGSYELRESPAPYRGILGHENERLRLENTYFWEHNS